MEEIFKFVIACLVTARVTRFVVFENGPYCFFSKLRNMLGADADVIEPGSLCELLNCFWCMSIFVAFIVVGIIDCSDPLGWITHSLAASFVASWLIAKGRE